MVCPLKYVQLKLTEAKGGTDVKQFYIQCNPKKTTGMNRIVAGPNVQPSKTIKSTASKFTHNIQGVCYMTVHNKNLGIRYRILFLVTDDRNVTKIGSYHNS